MAKKRKLGSKNPKYNKSNDDNTLVAAKRILACKAVVRGYGGSIVEGVTCDVWVTYSDRD